MTGHDQPTTSPDAEGISDEQFSHPSQNPVEAENLADNLPKVADMVARGELPIPLDWPADSLRLLLSEVHARRRRRLVELIARAIANDIRQSRVQQ